LSVFLLSLFLFLSTSTSSSSTLLYYSSACARVRLLLAKTLAPLNPSPSSRTAVKGIVDSSFPNLDLFHKKESSSGEGDRRPPPVAVEELPLPPPFPPLLLPPPRTALASLAVIPPQRYTPPVASDRSAIAPASAPKIDRKVSTASTATRSEPRAAAAVMAWAGTRGESTEEEIEEEEEEEEELDEEKLSSEERKA